MKLAYRFEATITEIVPIGLVPEGIRMDGFFKGSITDDVVKLIKTAAQGAVTA